MAAALSTQVVLLIKEIFLPQSMQHLSSDGGGHTLTTPVKSQQTDSEVFIFICMYIVQLQGDLFYWYPPKVLSAS